MRDVIANLIQERGKGIMATDESTRTLSLRFAEFGLPGPDEGAKRAYRELLYSTHGIENYLAGVILFDDMLCEATDHGERFVDVLTAKGILIGVTADRGRKAMSEQSNERVTIGLDGIDVRLSNYKAMGAGFCKWRAEFRIEASTPSESLISTNCRDIAAFASACQRLDLVPVVEPDVLIEGHHSVSDCLGTTVLVIKRTFAALTLAGVDPARIVVKMHMITPGDKSPSVPPAVVAGSTISALITAVPPAVPLVLFLSGGQPERRANANLAAICSMAQNSHVSHRLSFSFGRSLQREALGVWRGMPKNVHEAQRALLRSLEAASLATLGEANGFAAE